jgi:glycolate oxidase iron-sulfur subunit
MAYYAGDAGTARELALENIGRFAEYGADAIVTTCATCAVMLEKHYREFGGEKLPQVLTFSQFWAKVGAGASVVGAAEAKRSPPAGDPPLLAFHEPCHLRLGLGVKSGPRELLKSLKGARYVKTAGEDDCCGYGGVLNLENYDLSMKIGSGKRETLEAGGAGIVVTECAGCILQLTDILSRSEKPFEIITTAEAVERYA